MRTWIGLTTILLLSLNVVAQAAFTASRRYAELQPTQYIFGPNTAIAPFNNPPNYSTAVDAQVQPSTLVTDTNTFSATTDFTTLLNSDSGTFSVSGNVGTVVTTSSTGEFVFGSNASSLTVPQLFTKVQITQVGAAGGIFVGISNAGAATRIMGGYNSASSCFIWVFIAGSFHNIYSQASGCTRPAAPFYMGLSLVGVSACLWVNSSGSWSVLGCGTTTSFYDPRITGNLSGFMSAVAQQNGATTWKFANLVTGSFGAIGVRDVSLVTYPDGRPYMQGSTAYFTMTSSDPAGAGYDGVYSYDVVGGTLTQIGVILNVRSGSSQNDVASHLVYDPGNSSYRYMVGGWGTSTSPPTFYGSWSRAVFDPLANQSGLANASTQMTFSQGSGTNWDAHFACNAWNYSTLTCSNWIVGYTHGNATAAGDTSASDPSANTWAAIGAATSQTYEEGERITRTAATSSGVSYQFVYVRALEGTGLGGRENTFFHVTSSSSFSSLGVLTAQMAGGANNIPHPQIFSYGNTEYLLQFNDLRWSKASSTYGNLFVSTTPKYSAQTNYPSYQGGTSQFSVTSAASITSSAVTVTNGDIVVAYCRGANTAVASVALSSSVAIGSFTGIGFNNITTGGSTGWGEAFYVFATGGGSSTFTCTPSASSASLGITVMVYHPGFATVIDYAGLANQTGSSNSVYTSPSFSTTASGLIVVCADGLFGGGVGVFVPAFIGPYGAGPSNGLSSGAAACESTITTGAQSSITANMGSTAASPAQWGGAILSFK